MAQKEDIKHLLQYYSKGDISALIPVLQDVQAELGYLSEGNIKEVGNYFNIPSSRVYGIATYYNQFRFKQKAKFHFEICNGTSCFLENTVTLQAYLEEKFLKHAQKSDSDKLFSLEKVPCMACCAFSPVLVLNQKIYTKLTKKDIDDLFENLELENLND